MTYLYLVVVLIILPLFLLSVKILHNAGRLTEQLFSLMVQPYLVLILFAISRLYPPLSVNRIAFQVLTLLSLLFGHFFAKRIYKRYLD